MIGNDLFEMGVPVAEKVLRTVAVYGFILVLLRVAGRRDLAQLSTFDLVVVGWNEHPGASLDGVTSLGGSGGYGCGRGPCGSTGIAVHRYRLAGTRRLTLATTTCAPSAGQAGRAVAHSPAPGRSQ